MWIRFWIGGRKRRRNGSRDKMHILRGYECEVDDMRRRHADYGSTRDVRLNGSNDVDLACLCKLRRAILCLRPY